MIINRIKYVVFALATLPFVFMTGCGQNRDGSVKENKDEIHIRVWESKDGVDTFIKQAGQAYTAEHPNVRIDFVNVELHNTAEALENDAPLGIGPDIIAAPHDLLGSLVAKKLVIPTENPSEVANKVLKSCTKAITYNGTMYGYPVSAETYALFYNKNLIRENDVPKSWEDLVEWVQGFNESHPGKLGFVMDVTASYYSIIFLTAGGNRLYGESGVDSSHPNMSTPLEIKGMEFFQSLRESLGLQETELSTSSCDNLFASGNAAMYITGLWNVKAFEKAGINFGVTTIPALPGESTPAASFSGTRVMYVTACSAHPKEAADFLEFTLSPEMQQLRFNWTGSMPAISTNVNSPYISGFLKQLDYAFPMPSIPAMVKFWTESTGVLTDIWNGADVESSLKAFNEKIKG